MNVNKIIPMKYICIVFLLLFSCRNTGVKISTELEKDVKYYENGRVKSEGYLLNGQYHGSYKQYFQNGKLKVEAYYKHGKQDSIQKIYFENGNIRQIAHFKDDLIDGKMEIFNDDGRLIADQFFVVINDSSIANQLITYNEMGHIDKDKSNYFKLLPLEDTIEYGDQYEIDIKLEASLYNLNMLAIIGEFDENYNLIDNAKVDTLWDRSDGKVDFKVNYSTNQYEYGENIIRGIIFDYASYYEEDSPNDIVRSVRPLYFERFFYVKEKSN